MAPDQSAGLPGTQAVTAGGSTAGTDSGSDGDTAFDKEFATPVAGAGVTITPQLVQQAHFKEVDVPNSVIAGQTLTITGIIHHDNPVTIVAPVENRVVAESPHLSEPVIANVGKLPHCNTATFKIEIPAPQEANQQIAVTLKAENNPSVQPGWETNQTRGPFRVNVVTRGEKAIDQTLGAAPWIIGGAGVGAGGALAAGSSVAAGTALGAGVGASGYALSNADAFPRFTFPTEKVLATSVLFGTGALLLFSLPGTGADKVVGALPSGERVTRRLPSG